MPDYHLIILVKLPLISPGKLYLVGLSSSLEIKAFKSHLKIPGSGWIAKSMNIFDYNEYIILIKYGKYLLQTYIQPCIHKYIIIQCKYSTCICIGSTISENNNLDDVYMVYYISNSLKIT